MEEIFELIKAFNRLKEKVMELSGKIDSLLKPSPVYQQNPDEYVDEEQACKILHISPRTLARLCSEGALTFSKRRKRKIYKVTDLYQYLNRNRIVDNG
jgi:hypothetical protein